MYNHSFHKIEKNFKCNLRFIDACIIRKNIITTNKHKILMLIIKIYIMKFKQTNKQIMGSKNQIEYICFKT